jgi:hypothetical protein
MKRLLTFVLVLAVVVVTVGFLRGWFSASTAEAGGTKGIVFTWNEDKFKEDMGKATDKIKSVSESAVDKIKGKAKTLSSTESELEGRLTSVDTATDTVAVEVDGQSIPLTVPDAAGLERLEGKLVRVKLETTRDGMVVREIAEK